MSLRAATLLACAFAVAPIQPSVGEEGHDYPLVPRIEGYKIDQYKERRFDRFDFPLPDHKLSVEGHLIEIKYRPDGSQPLASDLEIYRSYKGLLDSLGGETLKYSETGPDGVIGRFTRNSLNVFIDVEAGWEGQEYYLVIVEERPFRPLLAKPESPPH